MANLLPTATPSPASAPPGIIGLNAHERLEKQDVCIRIRIHPPQTPHSPAQEAPEPETWRRLVRGVYDVVEPSELQTLEALAALVAGCVLREGGSGVEVERVTVRVEKPFAVTWVEGCGVEITRERGWVPGGVEEGGVTVVLWALTACLPAFWGGLDLWGRANGGMLCKNGNPILGWKPQWETGRRDSLRPGVLICVAKYSTALLHKNSNC